MLTSRRQPDVGPCGDADTHISNKLACLQDHLSARINSEAKMPDEDEFDRRDEGDENGENPEAQLVRALEYGDAKTAAAILRQCNGVSKYVCEALADLLGGDPIAEAHLIRAYAQHLVFAPWPVRGRPRRNIRTFERDRELAERVHRLIGQNMTVETAAKTVADACVPRISAKTVMNAYRREAKRRIFWKKTK